MSEKLMGEYRTRYNMFLEGNAFMISENGFILISVKMRNGVKYEVERKYASNGECLSEDVFETIEAALPKIKTGAELLKLLEENIEYFNDFIVPTDENGTDFIKSISTIADFDDVYSVIVCERAILDSGEAEFERLEFLNKSAKMEAKVTRSSIDASQVKPVPFVTIGIYCPKIAEYICNLCGGKTVVGARVPGRMSIEGDITTLVTLLDESCGHHLLSSYDSRGAYFRALDDKSAADPDQIYIAMKPFLPSRAAAEKDTLKKLLKAAFKKGNILAHTHLDKMYNFDWPHLQRTDFSVPELIFDDWGKVIGCKEKEDGGAKLSIPSYIEIKELSFRHCQTTKVIETGRVSLERGSFACCKSLETLMLGSVKNVLPIQVCEGCTALKKVVLPNDLYRIDGRAFYGCENLEDINIPDSLMFVDPTAFQGCDNLPAETQEKLTALSDRTKFDATINAVETYIQTHGDAKFRFDRWDYRALFEKKSQHERWFDLHAPYFDSPETLPTGKIVYHLYAEKGVMIDMSAYGWKQQKSFSGSVQYLIVDTKNIPNFDRFLDKQRAIDNGDLQKAANFGTNTLEKAIEAKKAGCPIRIITKAHLDACVAANVFK